MGIDVDRERIAEFCRRWKITELSLFGSVLRDDFRPASDVDVLVVFAPEADWGFGDLLQMEEEPTEIFGHKADLVDRGCERNVQAASLRTIR
ncbi:MAG: nucleotidyltransferase domain-containing protein [Gemmatimonadetes bacterium]|nr:nucleotidyltransferase domain-containing protein [Gemmatimonadota bacterium]